jgi:elongation factor G
MTQGRGIYTLEFDHYEAVPRHLAEEVVAHAKIEEHEGNQAH